MVENFIASLPFATQKPVDLYAPIAYGLEKGGKRLRPVLMLMSGEAFGMNAELLIKPAVGIEMFHNFTLLHDDVMDRSDVRRGRPTVYKKWDTSTAILSGDTMLTLASQLMGSVDDKVLRTVLDSFNKMAIEVYEGQALDMEFESAATVTSDQYLDMIGKKTGALLGASSSIGAIIAGASERDCQLLAEFGYMLGMAFQIQDDYLDMFGDAATFGKPIGGDVLNRKKTYLTVTVMEKGGSEAEALREAMEIQDGELRIRTVRAIYERASIPDLCREQIDHYSRKAMKAIRKSSMTDQGRQSFEKIIEKLIDRKK